MTSPRVRTASVAFAALIGVALSGCSSSGGTASGTNTPQTSGSASSQPLSRAAYKKLLAQIASEEQRAQNDAHSALTAGSVSDLRKGLLTFAADQDRVSRRLSSITPPADAQQANTALADAFAANATATRALADKLAEVPNMTLAKSLLNTAGAAAQQSGKAIDSALAKLKQLGYTKGS
jgi:hypothetical protein